MANFPELVVLAAVMGFAIFLSMPIVLSKSMRSRTVVLLNAVAIGILVFLLADVFGDVAPLIYSNPSNAGYIAVPEYAVAFFVAAVGCFLLLYFGEHQRPGKIGNPHLTALIIALAIGFQNLTEGLVFGANWAAGAIGLVSVIFLGFFIQNVTEGFPITSPLLGRDDRRVGLLAVFFLIGGLPTILGGIVGYFYHNTLLNVVFDSLAIGAILYCILPMLRVAFRPDETPEATQLRQRLLYLGVLVGFALGFVTNSI
jgi:zinc transporter, ZIP family